MGRICQFASAFAVLFFVCLIGAFVFAGTAFGETPTVAYDNEQELSIEQAKEADDETAEIPSKGAAEEGGEDFGSQLEEGANEERIGKNGMVESSRQVEGQHVAEETPAEQTLETSCASTETTLVMQASDNQLIADGDYVIKSGLPGCYALDVSGGSKNNGANIQIYQYNATGAQKWHVSFADGFYLFKNLNSKLFLEFAGTNASKSANVRQNTQSNSLSQKWTIKKQGDGFTIVSAKDSKYVIDVSGARAANGSNVQLYEGNGTDAQKFFFSLIPTSTTKYETPLEKGDYVIQSGVGGTYVVDVASASTRDGANVQIYSYNGSKAQKWTVSYDSHGLYTFTSNVVSGKALDVSGGKAVFSQNVQQYKSNGTKAQKWIVTKVGTQYKIASAIDPMFVLDVSGARAANGANVQLYADNGTSAQRFTLLPLAVNLPTSSDVADGVYAIAVKSNTGYVLDVAGGSVANSANVQLYRSNDTNAQRWGVLRGENGLYSIFNMASGKMLDVAGGSPLSGANICQYASNDTKAQQWAIFKNTSDGSFTIANTISGMVVDVSGGKIANSSNIQVYASNGTAAQKFSFIPKPLIEERVYTILSMRNTKLAVDVPGGSIDNGKALQVYESNDTPAQHVSVKSAGNGHYTLQMVNSAKYLTVEGSAVVQRINSSGAAQQWAVSLAKGGVVFTNVASGRAMSVAVSNPKNGTGLAATTAINSNRLFGLRTSNLLNDGLYVFTSAMGKNGRALDVASGSWSKGANVQLYSSNGSNAQKFAVKQVDNGYYRISAALNGLAVEVSGGSKSAGANVDINSWAGADHQLWKPVLGDAGLLFVNKKSGMVLGVAGGADKDSANVDQESLNGAKSQSWLLSSTSVNMADLSSMAKLVRAVSGSGSATASFSVASANWSALMNAIWACWNNGYDVGFLMTDVQSGNYVSLNADKTFYGASTMKGAYVTWIFQELLEKGRVSWGSVGDLITEAIVDSSNDAYHELRDWFGDGEFNSWLGGVGLGGWGSSRYAFYTPRELQLMWARMLAYEQSGGSYVGTWRQTFSHSYYSSIHDELGGEKTTYTKPGWYPRTGNYGALDDSGIVVGYDGRRYLLTIMSDIDCYGGEWIEYGIVRALNTIFDASPAV